MSELMSRTAVPRRVTAPHTLVTVELEASSVGAGEQEDVPETDYTCAYEADNLTLCVRELVADRAAATPEAPAVSRTGVLTYGEPDARAEQPAVRPRAAGLGTHRVAAVLQRRSPGLVVTLLSILKTGGACLVLDPEDPAERQARLARDVGAALLTAGDGLGDRAPADLGDERVPSLVDLMLGILTAIGWSRGFEVPEDEHPTFTEAHAALLGVFSAGLLPMAAEHLR
ncbi:AMP-binding protein [Streptomyces sp. NPDC056660]|uniref:AMP-binding protein n=1 Tax=Streptomyces sp. NPDC056660 TaxID=3345897 RepID=UPI0036B5BCCB